MKSIFVWIVKLIAVVILVQTLFFKFTGAEESVYIFSKLEAEPYGRIGSGIVELIASILILIPRTTLFGALIGAGTMMGAIFSHIIVLGIEVKDDGGTLFILALITLACCSYLIFNDRKLLADLIKLRFMFTFLIVLSFISCEESGFYTETKIANEVSIDSKSIKKGNFVPTSGISVIGSAELIQNGVNYSIKLNDFSISSGPDLKVYLSKTKNPNDFVNLGALMSAKNIYEIPQSVNPNDFDFVLIHCQQYNHLFAISNLK